VRGKPGQQRRCLAVLPGRGVEQREPLHDESGMNLARAAKTWKTSRPPGVVVSSASCRDRNPVPRRRSPATMVIRSGRTGTAGPGSGRRGCRRRGGSPGTRRARDGRRSCPAACRRRSGCSRPDQGACLPVQVLPGRGHAGVPDQRAGQVRRLGGERVVLIGDGEAGRVSITRNRTENGSAAVVRHSGFSTPFFQALATS
jgi:hypothetical protein